MAENDPTYLLLDGKQAGSPAEGWRAQSLSGIQLDAAGFRLALQPVDPVPLKDDAGTFGGLLDPTGIAVDPQGVVYIADGEQDIIYKVVRRDGMQPQAYFYRASEGAYNGDTFVYLPGASRLERWPHSLGRDPKDLSEVEVLCETPWGLDQAEKLITAAITSQRGQIDRQWQAAYPPELPAGELCRSSVAYLSCLGGKGRAPRRFDGPRGLAITPSGLLVVADAGNHRIQVFRLRGLTLQAVWGKRTGEAGDQPGQFNHPWDVASDRDGNIFIADRDNHRVQRYDCRTRRFSLIDGQALAAHFFQPLFGPHAGDRYVYVPARSRLERWPKALGRDPQRFAEAKLVAEGEAVAGVSQARQQVLEASGLRGAADPLVEWEADYPAALAAYPQPEPPFSRPTHLAIDAQGRLYVVDQDADSVKVLDPHGRVVGQVIFKDQLKGSFRPQAVAVDADGSLLLVTSGSVYRVQLDELSQPASPCARWRGLCPGLAVDATGRAYLLGGTLQPVFILPPQTGYLKEGVYLSQPLDSLIYRCAWHLVALDLAEAFPTGTSLTASTYTSEEILSPSDLLAVDGRDWQSGPANAASFLVLSPPGRYLWLKIVLRGGGGATPVLRGIKVHFPRRTYLQYLPAVYQADSVSKDFLERFLSVFESVLGGIEHKIDILAQYFDPDGVPPDFLAWLASWVDMAFDPNMPEDVRRSLLRNAPLLYQQRGTPDGLKNMLNLAFGVEAQILEAFQLRRWLFLNQQAGLGDRSRLWGSRITDRWQLDEHTRIGEFALVETGDPQRDPFHVQAHRFTVFLPAAQLDSVDTERRLRYMIEQEKPAHTQFTLEKVAPRFRVGVQSTLGLDTLVGAFPSLVLNQTATLCYDSLLTGAPEDAGPVALKIGQHAQVGVDTVVG